VTTQLQLINIIIIIIPRHKNGVNNPLIKPEKVYLPPLHIKLGLIKNLVKAMYQNKAGFT